MLLPPLRAKLFADFCEFGAEHLSSQDIDPVYPVLREFYRSLNWSNETALWFTTLYLAYYHLGSAIRAFDLHSAFVPNDDYHDIAFFPTATERRGLRGGKVQHFLDSYGAQVAGVTSQAAFLRQGLLMGGREGDELYNYEVFWDTIQYVWGNGRWAAFKWAEVLQQVHGFPLKAPDMRLQFCSGPKEGLELLFGLHSASTGLLNQCAQVLRSDCSAAALPLSWEQLETVLCDFNSLQKGHYYVGHDIDQMQEQLIRLESPLEQALYQARAVALPKTYLGEQHGWHGIDRARRTIYQSTQQIVTR